MVQIKFLRFPKVKVSRDPLELIESINDPKIKKFLTYVGVLADRTIFVFAEEDVVDLIPTLFADAIGIGTFLDTLIDPSTPREYFHVVETKDVVMKNGVVVDIKGLDKIGGISPTVIWNKEEVSDFAAAVNMLKKYVKDE